MVLLPALPCFHRGQGFHENRLQDGQRSFQNFVQARVAAKLFQLRPIQPGDFASCIDGNEEVFAALAFRGLDILGQSLLLQVERGTHCPTATATEQHMQFVERDFAGGKPDVERLRCEHGSIECFCKGGCVPPLIQRHEIVKACDCEH